MTPQAFAAANPDMPLDGCTVAPVHLANWANARSAIGTVLGGCGLPRYGILLIGDDALEQVWSEAGRLAGYLAADRYFEAVR